MHSEKALTVVDPTAIATLYGTDDPNTVLDKASAQATVLAKVVKDKKLFTTIQGKDHVQVEGWTFLGAMCGVFPVTVWTRPIPNGWEARVEARTLSGATVGGAEAECTRDEKTWSDRPDYALRSMAQTRATSKALRMPLGYIMTLAGYAATPAEEMTGIHDNSTPVNQGHGFCPVHKKPFVDGKYGPHCKSKNDDGSWCKEKPKKQEAAQGNIRDITDDEPPGMEYFDEPEQPEKPVKRPAEEVQAQVNRIVGMPGEPGLREQAGIEVDAFFEGVEEVYKTKDLWKVSDKARDTIERRLKERIAKAKAG